MIYNPLDWYWLRDDGVIYSSFTQMVIADDDARYAHWLAADGRPTRWPEDDTGEQTTAALQDVLSAHGIIVALDEIDAARQRQINSLTLQCAAAIVAGYGSDALGSVHKYPSKQIDQLNMMGSVTDALTPGKPETWKTPFWCADAEDRWSFRDHTAAQIIAAGQAGKAHIVACQTRLSELSRLVMTADTIEMIEAYTWPSQVP